ncbi:hypothetical protein CHF27_011225 [Romboutsia maritimum]|uniref:XkdN-like protein n=1 Tax=Romboutsia maritimum TaxID=2020948 RepID=A0A371IQY8_9FIRM|nr:hypothetical protein [Romboutsia maritimum]RDY22883.1 hypothetical protein CHF27_011225 [Romboutsia maritimum]
MLQVTSLEQLKAIKQAEIVNLGAFEDGTELIAEVKKPNLVDLMMHNKIPNSLMSVAMKVFNGKTKETADRVDSGDIKSFKEMFGLMETLAESCLVNPTYSQIKELGIDLTQDQLMTILIYTQGGVKALENFRKQQTNNENNQPSTEVQ